MVDARWLVAGAGALTTAVAVAPFVDRVADRDLVVHMTQHVVLLVVAPLLLAAATTRPARASVIAAALVAQAAAMAAWHVPALYDAANAHTAIHVAEHLSYLATGTWFWMSLGVGGAVHRGSAPIVFVAALPCTALGVALTVAPIAWYAAYPDLVSQQLAGVVMWAGGGTAYLLAAVALFVRWMAASERTTEAVR